MEKECSHCKEVRNVEEFYKDKRNKDGLRNDCRECSIAATQKWQKEHPEWGKIYRREQIAQWNNLLKILALVSCVICGSNAGICFHHPYPDEKIREIGRIKERPISEEGVAELRKTVPLCQSCHMALHKAKKANAEWDRKIREFYDYQNEREISNAK